MANPQPEKGFVKLANDIWNEIIRRDFSKRQKDVILFIWRLSYGCQRKSANIPKLKDFELCGIGAQNIKKELDYLVSCRVISWDKPGNEFAVNKDYEVWQVSPVRGWDEDRFRELISLNLGAATSQNKKLETSQNKKLNEPGQTVKSLTTSQNKKLRLLKTRSRYFLKQEARLPEIPYGCRRKRVSKDIIKDNIKNKKDIEDDRSSHSDPNYESFYAAHTRLFQRELNPWQLEKFMAYIEQDGLDEKVVIHALERMKKKADNYSLNFALSTLDSYFKAGAKTLEKAMAVDETYDSRRNARQHQGGSGGYSKKPPIEMVGHTQQSTGISPEELEELRQLAKKLDEPNGEPVPY